jgi:hypothetical protein
MQGWIKPAPDSEAWTNKRLQQGNHLTFHGHPIGHFLNKNILAQFT